MVLVQEKMKTILLKQLTESKAEELTSRAELSSVIRIIQAIENSDATSLSQELGKFSNIHNDQNLRKEQHDKLGHLARQFQNSLIEFRDGLGARTRTEEQSSGEAQAQIESVIAMTNKAAMSVFDLSQQQLASCNTLVDKVTRGEFALSGVESYPQLQEKYTNLERIIVQLHCEMGEYNKQLILSQSYQDLSGQVLLRVKEFMDSIERGLIEMVKLLAADAIEDTLNQIDSKKILNNCNQSDVDELLASLGF